EPPRRGLPWGAPDTHEWTNCMGARNILYTIRSSNDFEPRVFRPLQFAAIGTGQGVRGKLHRAPQSVYVERFTEGFMDDYMRTFTEDEGLKDCGGLHPMLEVSSRGPQARTSERTVFFRGGSHVRIGLVHEQGRWSQRNYTTGRHVDLLPPWMLDGSPPDELFEDLDEAVAAQRIDP
ncbi:MAG TPA: hypothetical protein VEQ84_12390, partial [Vicinamibacteria bacterium]|nr:hypothetical protein [Vicinamibacteria bacterium]